MGNNAPKCSFTWDHDQIIQWDRDCVMQNYARKPVVFVRGEGVRLYDARGKQYLDFLGGIAVDALGHCHPKFVEAMHRQLDTLIHVSNLYYNGPQACLAKMLTDRTGLARAFFCNSGAEANEAAIKLTRKWAKKKLGPNATQIITMENSFHGRTLGTIAATGQPKFRVGFEPTTPGFMHVPFNDISALEAAIDSTTCGVMMELIQCESGVRMPSPEYVREVRALCDRKGIALIIDEVQTGMGRTGKLFAHENFGIKPDVMSVAKALGSGIPIGACLATEDLASAFVPGDHGTTFGGNPFACCAGITTIETMEELNLLDNCVEMGNLLQSGLKKIQERNPIIKEVRGIGLMQGVELNKPFAKEIGAGTLEKGLVINSIGDRVLRMSPPLIITKDDVAEALGILDTLFTEYRDR